MKYQIGIIVTGMAVVGFTSNPGGPAAGCKMTAISCDPGTRSEMTLKIENVIAYSEPWTESQLLAPADLAAVISDPKAKKPIIICVGPGALIKGSLDTGPAKEKENLEKLKLLLAKLPKDADIVIYCGCCPFEHCPNIRPAFTLLNEMKFTKTHLLNLEYNIRTDWVAKGYPQ